MTGSLLLDVVLGVLLPLPGGALVGAGVRAVLTRVRRPVLVPRGWCELGTAFVCGMVATAAVVGLVAPARVPVLLVVSVSAVAGTATDVVAGRLPDVLTVPALGLGLVALIPSGALGAGLGGALALGGLHAVVALVAPNALGGGDVKLAAALGGPLAATGWWAVAAAPVGAALVVLVLARVRRVRSGPLGPALLTVSWVVLLAGG
ncbi:prepilin peptidase [Actinomycetospora endophytica]|uniref:Prepilin peptidase n=1 Tax=Actinomycetospora endophytica TaxID=2291215 RepID=A0ABS8PHQ5_9PSEU|nr:prepilin peptidase [Actinomycetospora endophytica]MCD2197807.1 prepilin peptidase [Actinomycetospora endophytica]